MSGRMESWKKTRSGAAGTTRSDQFLQDPSSHDDVLRDLLRGKAKLVLIAPDLQPDGAHEAPIAHAPAATEEGEMEKGVRMALQFRARASPVPTPDSARAPPSRCRRSEASFKWASTRGASSAP